MIRPPRTATSSWRDNRSDLRHRRATMLASALMHEIEQLLPNDICRRDIYDAMFEVLHGQGVEVLTDYDREKLGLPKRDRLGWTEAEVRAYDQRLLIAFTTPTTSFFALPGYSLTERKP